MFQVPRKNLHHVHILLIVFVTFAYHCKVLLGGAQCLLKNVLTTNTAPCALGHLLVFSRPFTCTAPATGTDATQTPPGTHAALQRIVDHSPLALLGLLDTGTLTTVLQTDLPARLGTQLMPLALPYFSTGHSSWAGSRTMAMPRCAGAHDINSSLDMLICSCKVKAHSRSRSLSEKPYSAGSSSSGTGRASRPSGSSLALKWPLT